MRSAEAAIWIRGMFAAIATTATPTAHPGATEICDGYDNDCDTVVPANEMDGDSDGSRICDGDCDDGDADTLSRCRRTVRRHRQRL